MENVPPPPGLGWAARGTKRTHSQISGRQRTASHRTRSPSTTHSSAPNHSSTSNTSADPDSQDSASPSRFDPSPITFSRLPSFRELDAARRPLLDLAAEEPPPTNLSRSPSAYIIQPSAAMDVIDLTNEPDEDFLYAPQQPRRADPSPFGEAVRGPRFAAEIIDLSGDTPRRPWQEQAREGPNGGPAQDEIIISSPEVQFLRARPRSPRLRYAGTTPPAHLVPVGRPDGRAPPIDIPEDDDDIQVVHHRHHSPPIPPPPPPGHLGNIIATLGDATARVLRETGFLPRATISHRAPRRVRHHVQHHLPHVHGQFDMPNLDFGFAAFDLGYGPDEPTREREESVIPAPPPVPEGFTRNPTEEDVLVCPNCDAELSMGDDDIKRQVWLAKACGHIYCGECAASRLAPKPRKGKEPMHQKIKPLKMCVVEECNAKTTGKQMIQLFL